MMSHHSTDVMATRSWTDDYNNYVFLIGTTEKWQPEESPHVSWILPTLYSIFFLVGLLGNVVVIAVVTKRSSRRADTFILNLAVSDLLFVLTLPLWITALAQGYWPFEDYTCKASSFAIAVTRCASSLLMAVMSVDRYVAVIKGKKMHPLRTRSCSLVACSVIWVVSVLIGSPSLVFRHQINTSACEDSDKSSSPLILPFKMVVIFFTFVLPFAVVLFCYGSMAKYLWNYFGKQVRTMTSTRKPRCGHSWLRVVSCVVGAFCLSWLPFNTVNAVEIILELRNDMTSPTYEAIQQAKSFTSALAFANSCSNPLIYALLDAGFRRRAQLSLPRLFLMCRSMLPIPGWSVPTANGSMKSTSTYTSSDK